MKTRMHGLVVVVLLAINPSLVAQAGGKFGGRDRGPVALQKSKGGKKTADAIQAGLAWLAEHQQPDGSWPGESSPMLNTSLAVLAFLADGTTPTKGKYQVELTLGLTWLGKRGFKKDWTLRDPNTEFSTYELATATLALVEAYGLSADPKRQEPAQRAVDSLTAARNADGGWGYRPTDQSSHPAMLGHAVMALVAARDFQLDLEAGVLKDADKWLDSVIDFEEGQVRPGGDPASTKLRRDTTVPGTSQRSMHSTALLAAIFLGRGPGALRALAGRVVAAPPEWSGDVDLHAWHFGTYAMFQMGASHWLRWKNALEPALLESQQHEGDVAGSWDPIGEWGKYGGRAYTTALATLCLQVYYRYTRLAR